MSCEDIDVESIPGKGRGIVAQKQFAEGQVIEQVPVIIVPDPQWKVLEQTALKDYYLYWDEHNCAIPLGFCAFYNHSDHANAMFIRHADESLLEIKALRDIEVHEEITVEYHCPPWFMVIS
jgi:uncharacterized protein